MICVKPRTRNTISQRHERNSRGESLHNASSFSGRTTDSDSVNLGSNPSEATRDFTEAMM